MRYLRIDYFSTSNLWLSCERFHNAGLKSKRIKEIIESMNDPFTQNNKLTCTSQGINGNWNVETFARTPAQKDYVVEMIEDRLNLELERMNK